MDYRIEERPAFTVIGKKLRVSCVDGENNRLIPHFWQEVKQDGTEDKLISLGATNTNVFGVCTEMEGDDFTYIIAVEQDPSKSVEDYGFVTREIPASTWAIFTSIGPMPDAIQKVWARIYQEWFPDSSFEQAGGPSLEVYPRNDVDSEDYRCEVWIPIVKK